MECLNCNTIISQTPGKRPKLYCSSKCRIEFCRRKKAESKPKRGRGRPKKIVIPAQLPDPLPKKFIGIIEGPMKEVLQEASKGNAKLGIEAMIAAIKAEKIPTQRDTPMGRKSWALDQKKRIQELEKQLNEH